MRCLPQPSPSSFTQRPCYSAQYTARANQLDITSCHDSNHCILLLLTRTTIAQPGATGEQTQDSELAGYTTLAEGDPAEVPQQGITERAKEAASGMLQTVEDMATGLYQTGKKSE